MQIETLQAMNDGLSRSLLLMLEVTVLIVVIGVSVGFVIYLAGIAWLCFEEIRQPTSRRMKPACPAKTSAANPVIRKVSRQRAQILPLLLFLIFSFTGCGKSATAARQELAQMNIPFTEMEFLASARQGNSTAAGLFIDAGIDVEARDSVGQTALMAATLANQPETVRVLLAKGADPDAKDKYGGTALMTAAELQSGHINTKAGAYGLATLNLIDKSVSVEVQGFSEAEELDFWLVDNQASQGTILPEAGDVMVKAGSLRSSGGVAKLDASFSDQEPKNFEPDFIAITRAGKSPVEDRLLTAQTTLYHRLYYSGQQGRFGTLSDSGQTEQTVSRKGIVKRVVDFFSPTAQAQGPIPNPSTPLQQLITQGQNTFNNGTFNGNGRTCSTCHREENNLTIDPEFIATLPPTDPLFVAEFNPALSQNFENPVLMRKFGLILENVDGFDDLEDKFVMRSVPHTLAMLPDTLKPAELDETHPPFGPVVPPLERTGWSGDGAPVGTFTLANGTAHQATGTLRDFLIGAIIQHYTKTLNRVPGVDFTMPTVAQLDALEAFQKSLGRRQNLKLAGAGALELKSEMVRKGQEIFNNPGTIINPLNGQFLFTQPSKGAGRCLLCHFNGGASDFVEGTIFGGNNDPGTGTATNNSNFDTGIEDQPFRPFTLLVPAQKVPPDGGFGRDPIYRNGKFLGFGNGAANAPVTPPDLNKRTFNTPVLVEAADTGPFFHDNSITTIEGAVEFYNSDSFNNSPIGQNIRSLDPSGIGIHLETTEVEAVAAFLRVINVLENIRSSVDLNNRAKAATSFSQAQELIKLSLSELDDAIEVLNGGHLHPEAQKKLRQAAAIDAVALITPNSTLRNQLINQAIALKNSARADMAN